MGDNIYPKEAEKPTKEEITEMMGLFKRPYLKDLSVYGVRGNHDCYFDDDTILLNLAKTDSQWKMPSFYYKEEFPVGENGEKFGMMAIDSCLLLCSEEMGKMDHQSLG